MKTDKGLTQQQEMFCLEFCKDLNASRAYASAYPKAKGYGQSGFKLLKNAEIISRIKEILTPVLQDKLVTVEEVITGIKNLTASTKEEVQLRAWELLGKYLAIFTDKSKVELGLDDETKDAVRDLREKLL